MLMKIASALITIAFTHAALADPFDSSPVPINIPSVKPAPKKSAPKPADKKAEVEKPAVEFTQVDINTFFNTLQYCGDTTEVQSKIIDGKIYGEKDGTCHFGDACRYVHADK